MNFLPERNRTLGVRPQWLGTVVGLSSAFAGKTLSDQPFIGPTAKTISRRSGGNQAAAAAASRAMSSLRTCQMRWATVNRLSTAST
jgi:hypothetical protein